MAAIEQVAQQGLACVSHMSIEVGERRETEGVKEGESGGGRD